MEIFSIDQFMQFSRAVTGVSFRYPTEAIHDKALIMGDARPGEIENLRALSEWCELLGLDYSVVKVNRIIECIEANEQITWTEFKRMAEDFTERVEDNVKSRRFFYVTPGRALLYEDPGGWFGEACIDRFPSIERDVRDACQCFGVEQWTASVFHAMRVLEHGLRLVAAEIGITSNLDLQQWASIIEMIESEVTKLDKAPRTTRGSQRNRSFSQRRPCSFVISRTRGVTTYLIRESHTTNKKQGEYLPTFATSWCTSQRG